MRRILIPLPRRPAPSARRESLDRVRALSSARIAKSREVGRLLTEFRAAETMQERLDLATKAHQAAQELRALR